MVSLFLDGGRRREGGREGGKEGGREGRREGGREGGRERGREGGREGGRERGREGGREGGRKSSLTHIRITTQDNSLQVLNYFLFGVSAKHLREEVSTTVSQNATTGSETLISESESESKHCSKIIHTYMSCQYGYWD